MTALELMNALGDVEEELTWPLLSAPARRRPRRALRAALVAAAIFVLLALAALAASESGLLERWFSPGSYDLIADCVSRTEAVAENDALRLTLHEAVTDGACTLVVYSVERLDGESMEGWGPDVEIAPLLASGRASPSGSRSNMTIGMEEPAVRTYLWECSADEQALQGVSIRLLGLKKTVGEGRLDAGSLQLEAALTACPVRSSVRGGEPEDGEIVVDLRLSPLSLRVRSWKNLAGMTPEDAEIGEDRMTVNGPWEGKAELVFRDGSVRDVSGSIDGRNVSSTGENVLRGSFWDLPDVDRVKAVRIDGRTYPLAKGEAPAPRRGLGGDAAPLDSLRAWTYGSHEPVHPELTAAGEKVTLSLDSVWTDGYTAELLLAIDAPQEADYWTLVNEGGYLTFDARDEKGRTLGVSAKSGGLYGLLSLVVECSGRAAVLTIGDGDAALTIPLDMKTLAKLPQIEPKQAGDPGQADAGPAEAYWQAAYDSLFGGLAPDDTGYTGNNGEYELKLAYLYLTEEPGEISLRGWAEARRLDGKPYVMSEETLRAFMAFGLKDGEEVRLSGGMGHTGGLRDGVRVFCLNWSWYYGDFSVIEGLEEAGLPTENLDLTPLELDALRVVWTPPEGGRITLDLPFTE